MKSKFKNPPRGLGVGLLLLQVGLLISLIAEFITKDLHTMTVPDLMNASADCVALAVLALMFFSGLRTRTKRPTTLWFMLIIFVDSVYTFAEGITMLAEGELTAQSLLYAMTTVCFLCGLVLAQLFWHFFLAWMEEDRPIFHSLTIAVDVVAFVGVLVILCNSLGNYYFSITPEGHYMAEEIYAVSLICPTVILSTCGFFILKSKTISVTNKTILISYSLFPWCGALLDTFLGSPSFLCIAIFLSVVFIYGSVLVRRDEMLTVQQAELTESRMQSMLMQINPHFIYNTLGSISSLCSSDPKTAEKMLLTFSDYLRNNFGELAHKNMIPIEKEMEHLNLYLSIEKSRFPDITVQLDLQATSFEIPSLTIQPLAENAITHGIMGRESGGTLSISTFEDEENWYVRVEDDGVGFETLEKNDGRRHVGVQTVRDRLRLLCDGELRLDSIPGVGTRADITIPKPTE